MYTNIFPGNYNVFKPWGSQYYGNCTVALRMCVVTSPMIWKIQVRQRYCLNKCMLNALLDDESPTPSE